MFRREKGQQHFGFDLEVFRVQRQRRPGSQMDKPEAGLGVGQRPPRALRKFPAHPPVHLPTQPGHFMRLIHAVADHQQRPGLFGATQQRGQIFRRVLAVAIERHRPFITLLQRARQSSFERRAFAQVALMFEHAGTGIFGAERRVIR